MFLAVSELLVVGSLRGLGRMMAILISLLVIHYTSQAAETTTTCGMIYVLLTYGEIASERVPNESQQQVSHFYQIPCWALSNAIFLQLLDLPQEGVYPL